MREQQPTGSPPEGSAIGTSAMGHTQQWSRQPQPGYPAPASSSKADAAFTLGIVSIFLNVFYVPGILAIVWGGRERRESGKARTGFICGIIGTLLSALLTLLIVAVIASAGSAVNTAAKSLPSTPASQQNLSPSASGATPPASTPSPASPAKAGYNLGATAKTGDFMVTVYGFKNPQPSTNTFITPKPGMHYVSVDVQITNPDLKSQRAFSSLIGFHLLDAQNFQYTEDLMDAGLTPGAPDGELAAGQSVRGYVGFEVPDTASGLKLRIQGGLTAAGAVFNLA
ncbi:MAG: DUF4352 domain-containing protein [Actinomycetota bacterium]|nr:DUF4352 domain-containing protein [Actinomycetota bacterium]